MANNLDGKVILITGASSGLGKAIAKRLSAEKVILVLLSRAAEKLQDVAHELSAKGSTVSCFSCNVVDIQQIKNAIEYVTEAYGKIDILINCAAIWNEGQPEFYTEQKVRELFDVNSIGVISIVQEVLPIMKKMRSGHILNVISRTAVNPYINSSIYTSTKYAVRGFTESLQVELHDTPIKVTGFYPGAGMDGELFNTTVNSVNTDSAKPAAAKIAEAICDIINLPEDTTVNKIEIN